MQYRQAGFSLIEVLVAGAIASIVLFALLAATHTAIDGARAMNGRLNANAAALRLEERLSSEAASAWAVDVPALDVLGASNTDGHEVEFFAEDASHRRYLWAYRYDASAKQVVRYAYAPGVAPVAQEITGPIDGFSARAAAASAITSPQSALYDPLFAGTTVADVAYPFPGLGISGGNGLVRVRIAAGGADDNLTLASATAPTSFTIVIPYTPAPQPSPTATPSALPTW